MCTEISAVGSLSGPKGAQSLRAAYPGDALPRSNLVFGDIEGKLNVLRVECTKCDRKGGYHVHKLIEKYGRTGKHDEMAGNAQR